MFNATLADVIGPETRQDMIRAFGSDVFIPQPLEEGTVDIKDTLVTGSHVWYKLWLFGLIEDQDVVSTHGCGDLWRPYGRIANGYYIPDDIDTNVSIDNPPEGVYGARPI